MNVVFLSPHFPPWYYLFCVRLKEAGATVLGIADEPYEALRPELKEALTEYFRVSDMHHYDELLRALGYFTFKYGKIDRIDSLNEYWLETEARLRTDFNIPGIDLEGIAHVKRKSEMKRLFMEAGLKVARGKVAQTAAEAAAFVAEVGYPVVAKPDIGVGAAKTYKITNDEELAEYLLSKPPVDYILEEFISGTIVTYDGLTDREGNVVFASTMIYSTGVMESVNLGLDIWYYIPREMPSDLDKAGKAVAKAFDVRERPFHFEFFRQADGGLVALEVNMRPPGGFTIDMFNYANDMDFYREWANILVHGRFEATITRPYNCAFVSRKDHKHYAIPHEQILHRYGHLIVHHARINDVFAAAIGNYGYILRCPDMAPIEEAAAAIHLPA